ncbi:hypothetical protein ACHAXT_010763 [Thalassiosira profunda]
MHRSAAALINPTIMLSKSVSRMRSLVLGGNGGQVGDGGGNHPKRSVLSSGTDGLRTAVAKLNGLPQSSDVVSDDEMFVRLRGEAAEVVRREPILSNLLSKVGLVDATVCGKSEPATSFEEIISRIVAHRLSSCSGKSETICPDFLRKLIQESFDGGELELGHSMSEAVRQDALAVLNRDPACVTLLEVVLFFKGFHALVLHRTARRAWKPDEREGDGENPMDAEGFDMVDAEQARANTGEAEVSMSGKRFVALLLQSQASSAFGVDIHPACSIGAGVMIDHASGVVIGETATIGDGSTILHGVTLGGTGKEHGDRHPKIGKDVLIGAGTKILGNITVGDRAKIGAGSVVLRPIPSGATAVGAPAKIIGYTPQGERPGSSVDMKLEGVEPLLGKKLSSQLTGSITEGTTSTESLDRLATTDEETTVETELPEEESERRVSEGDTEESTSQEEEVEARLKAFDKEAGEEESHEDDDDVTDFGTKPKCRYVKISKHNDGLCPFNGAFRDVSSTMKGCSISHSELRALLIQEGCTEGECVEVFFALLHRTPSASKARQCGCIPLEIFSRDFPEIAMEKTRLDRDTANALARGDLRALGMSKKASRRFRSVFANLGRQAVSALPKIPSSGSLSMSAHGKCCAMRKSERDAMGEHLDTAEYAAEINI